MLKLSQFTYDLPEKLIAKQPVVPRDHSRLLRLDRLSGKISHHHFYDLPDLRSQATFWCAITPKSFLLV